MNVVEAKRPQPSTITGVGSKIDWRHNHHLGNRRCGARACNDNDKTWAESGSYSESKISLSMYRRLLMKN